MSYDQILLILSKIKESGLPFEYDGAVCSRETPTGTLSVIELKVTLSDGEPTHERTAEEDKRPGGDVT